MSFGLTVMKQNPIFHFIVCLLLVFASCSLSNQIGNESYSAVSTTSITVQPDIIEDITLDGIRYNRTSMVEVLSKPKKIVGSSRYWSGYYDGQEGDYYKGSFDQGVVVTLEPYYIGQYHVTQKLYEAVMNSHNQYNYGEGEIYPAYFVSWYDAIAFCSRLSLLTGKTPCYTVDGVDWASLAYEDIPTQRDSVWDAVSVDPDADGYRLPTEAEWECAARGGEPDSTEWFYAFSGVDANGIGIHCEFGWLAEDDNLSKTAWYESNSNRLTNPVGLKAPNRLGIFDMSGNVWQWCWDWYKYGESKNINRTVRGGSFNSYAYQCVVSLSYPHLPYGRYYGGGFRIVCKK